MNLVSDIKSYFRANFECPCCGGRTTINIQDRIGKDGRIHEVHECLHCHAYLNQTDLVPAQRKIDVVNEQVAAAMAFYRSPTIDEVAHELEACRGLLDNLLSRFNCSRTSFLDFGAGRGFLAGAATAFFEKVFALEPGSAMIDSSYPSLPNRERISLLKSIDELSEQVDVITMWHVLEHLPRLHSDLSRVITFLKRGGSIFFQVPMYEKEHLVDCHYTFLNRPSCEKLCAKVGLIPLSIEMDLANNFLTCAAKKSSC